MVDAYLAAVRADDDEALASCYAEDCAWLTPDGVRRGRQGAMARHRELRAAHPAIVRVDWEAMTRHGAHVALWWVGRDAHGAPVARGMAVMEVRAGRIRLKADHVVAPLPA